MITKDRIYIPKQEYLRLKKVDEKFSAFFAYLDHIMDIRKARNEVIKKRVIRQDVLFKKLGF